MGCIWKVIRVFVAIFVLVLIYVIIRFGPDLWNAYKVGFFEQGENRKYQGTSLENVRGLYSALALYHDSEEMFPESSHWMDATKPRMLAADLAEEEALKKFVNPLIPQGQGVFGYAMNDAASRKYRDDIPNPDKTPLVFDSSDTSWNAHGNPAKLLPDPPRPGGNIVISATGALLKQ